VDPVFQKEKVTRLLQSDVLKLQLPPASMATRAPSCVHCAKLPLDLPRSAAPPRQTHPVPIEVRHRQLQKNEFDPLHGRRYAPPTLLARQVASLALQRVPGFYCCLQ